MWGLLICMVNVTLSHGVWYGLGKVESIKLCQLYSTSIWTFYISTPPSTPHCSPMSSSDSSAILPQNLTLDLSESSLQTHLTLRKSTRPRKPPFYLDSYHYHTKIYAEGGLVGKLDFLSHTRPDLCFSIQLWSQFMHMPRMSHVLALHHVFRYVVSCRSGYIAQSFRFPNSTNLFR